MIRRENLTMSDVVYAVEVGIVSFVEHVLSFGSDDFQGVLPEEKLTGFAVKMKFKIDFNWEF